MQGMALGEIGLSSIDFYRMTYSEYHYVAKAYMLKDEREWLRTRMLASLLINVQLPKDKHISPEQLFALPSDNLIKTKKPTPTREEFDRAVAKYRKE
jgi:hypothetical protein